MRVAVVNEEATEGEEGAKKPETKWEELGDRQVLKHGALVYREQCASCHGITGDGRGPAAKHLNPPPPDLEEGLGRMIRQTAPGGYLLFYPTKGCWELVSDVAYRRQPG